MCSGTKPACTPALRAQARTTTSRSGDRSFRVGAAIPPFASPPRSVLPLPARRMQEYAPHRCAGKAGRQGPRMSQATATAPRSRIASASPAPRPHSRNLLALAALGVVFGDIGTSPLYAMQAIFTGDHPVRATPADVYGVISLVAWALTLMVSIKFVVFVMRAD